MAVELLENETRAMRPMVLPQGWRRRTDIWHGVYSQREGLSVIWSVERIAGKRWRHLSVAGTKRIPTYEELTRIKHWILGPEAKAIQVFAPRSEHVNVNPFVLHLWECLDGEWLPDFRREGGL